MNLSPRWLSKLAEAGLDATHWSRVGEGMATDASIMDYARCHDMVVLTHDLDFGAILAATGGGKPSVVQIGGDDVNPMSIGTQVVDAIAKMQGELEAGALLTVSPGRNRLSVLPLKLA